MRLIILILLLMPLAYAQVTLSLNQTEYYFLIGSPAIIPLEINSTLDAKGTLSYTVTQEIAQNNMIYQSTNSQKASYSVEKGYTIANLDFQSSDSPSRYDVKIEFIYSDKIVDLEMFSIHFVGDQSQKQQSSQETKSTEQTQPPKPSQEQIQKEKFQNSQLSQDTKTLKQEMEQKMEKTTAQNQQFEKNLLENKEFQEMQDNLLDQGFKETKKNLNPSSNSSGTFEIEYEQNGTKANIRGEMEDGQIKEMTSDVHNPKDMLDTLYNDKRFIEYEKKLIEKGFERNNTTITPDKVIQEYKSTRNQTASITGEFEDDRLKVSLKQPANIWPWLILFMAGLGLFLLPKKKKEMPPDKKTAINYKKASLDMIDQAEKLFSEKLYKDAYGKAAQAIRFFHASRHRIGKELTSHETITLLEKADEGSKNTRDSLNMCAMVEFARYTPNKKDFSRIIINAKEIIKNT